MAASVAGAIGAAAEKVRKELLRLAKKMKDSPLAGVKLADVMLGDGKLMLKDDPSRAVAVADVLRHAKLERLEQQAEAESNDDGKRARYAHSAVFAEVRVDEELGIIRVTRIVNAVAAGRILNPKTARSQVIGAMTMGVGAALMEELVVDKRSGFFVNHDLAGYEVPVHADIPHLDMIFLDESDPMSTPMKAKGIAELGICGVAAAVANAVYNATGVRVRDYPVTLDKLLMQMPKVG